MSQQQTCKICNYPDKFNYNVPDEIWEAVVPYEFRNRVVCLACFDRLAYQKGINYARHLRTLYFTGDKACFKFIVCGKGIDVDE